MAGIPFISAAALNAEQQTNPSGEFASFGAVHLNITSLEKSIIFWTKIAGMKLRVSEADRAELGTASETLVVIHQSAKKGFREGYSGLYHFAIHAKDKNEFARMLYRLIQNQYPYSPVDHLMSKSLYLYDPDGIHVEFTLESPERFKRIVADRGLQMEDVEGNIHPATSRLDINKVLLDLTEKDINRINHEGTKIGHIHFYAADVEKMDRFYKQLGFVQFTFLPQFLYADVGAGGVYRHRVAMNSWHGSNRPVADKESAGLKHFQLIYESKEKLTKTIAALSGYEETNGGYWVHDPTGNLIFLSAK